MAKIDRNHSFLTIFGAALTLVVAFGGCVMGCSVDRSTQLWLSMDDQPDGSVGLVGNGEDPSSVASLVDAGVDSDDASPDADDDETESEADAVEDAGSHADVSDAATESETEDEDPKDSTPDAAIADDDDEDIRPDIIDDEEVEVIVDPDIVDEVRPDTLEVDYVDADSDSYSPLADDPRLLDCDDYNAAIHPNEAEHWMDLTDADCSGIIDPPAEVTPYLAAIRLNGFAAGISPMVFSNTNNFLAEMTWNADGRFYETAMMSLPPKFFIKWPYDGRCTWHWVEDGQTFCGETSFYESDQTCHFNLDTVQVVHTDGTLCATSVVPEGTPAFTCRRQTDSTCL